MSVKVVAVVTFGLTAVATPGTALFSVVYLLVGTADSVARITCLSRASVKIWSMGNGVFCRNMSMWWTYWMCCKTPLAVWKSCWQMKHVNTVKTEKKSRDMIR